MPARRLAKSKGSSDDMDEGVENIVDETMNEHYSDVSPTYKIKINSIFDKKNPKNLDQRHH